MCSVVSHSCITKYAHLPYRATPPMRRGRAAWALWLLASIFCLCFPPFSRWKQILKQKLRRNIIPGDGDTFKLRDWSVQKSGQSQSSIAPHRLFHLNAPQPNAVLRYHANIFTVWVKI
ncbi:hypothetical protein Y032_0061g3297 [Ancylostoma ceylanicum]|uniref:Uncharacterized protein n=1 Tax=Ancylostoma ceylanicum TaxID=53326 RepID=A0A016U300_9BILA|nr:hypothetical protein Y032_0061g3297 [Ancylostoma ceylanicum]